MITPITQAEKARSFFKKKLEELPFKYPRYDNKVKDIALEFSEIYLKHVLKYLEETKGLTDTAKIQRKYEDSLHMVLRIFYARFRIPCEFEVSLAENSLDLAFSNKLRSSISETMQFLGSIFIRAKDACCFIFGVEFCIPSHHAASWERKISSQLASLKHARAQ